MKPSRPGVFAAASRGTSATAYPNILAFISTPRLGSRLTWPKTIFGMRNKVRSRRGEKLERRVVVVVLVRRALQIDVSPTVGVGQPDRRSALAGSDRNTVDRGANDPGAVGPDSGRSRLDLDVVADGELVRQCHIRVDVDKSMGVPFE